jgi:hypothetical protein
VAGISADSTVIVDIGFSTTRVLLFLQAGPHQSSYEDIVDEFLERNLLLAAPLLQSTRLKPVDDLLFAPRVHPGLTPLIEGYFRFFKGLTNNLAMAQEGVYVVVVLLNLFAEHRCTLGKFCLGDLNVPDNLLVLTLDFPDLSFGFLDASFGHSGVRIAYEG